MAGENSLIDDFVNESGELLENLESHFNEVLQTQDGELFNRIFRAVHTVKGTAGFLGFLNVKNFAHSMEDVLDQLRSGSLRLTQDLHDELVQCVDLLATQIPRTAQQPPTHELLPAEQAALDRLSLAVEAAGANEDDPATILQRVHESLDELAADNLRQWVERTRMLIGACLKAAAPTTTQDWVLDPAGLMYVAGAVDVTDKVLPCLNFLCDGRENKADKNGSAAFLTAASALAAALQSAGAADAAKLVQQAIDEGKIIHDSPLDFDAMLVSTLEDKLVAALTPLVRAAVVPMAKPEATGAAPVEKPTKAAEQSDAKKSSSATVRVREEALDQFIWHVGETFLALELYKDLQNRLSTASVPPKLVSEFNELNRELTISVGKLQQSVMDVRRVPIGTLVNRVPAMVRQLSTQLSKQVDVQVEGADQLVDKSLLQELEGPMTHLIRNALDHGLQGPDERKAAGLDPTGRLIVRCKIDRDTVNIELEDNGRGIDRKRVLNKALEKGVVTDAQAAQLNDEQILMLICRPGFSTAEQISDVSGRGVGLDVVMSTIERNRGKMRIESTVGAGTKFILNFPLRSTVLMVDGLVCETSGCHAAFSVDYIQEVVQLTPNMVQSVNGKPTAVVRNHSYPVIPLSKVLGVKPQGSNQTGRGIILHHQHKSAILRVDRLAGYRKLVLKDFDRDLIDCQFLTGVAQLGGSTLALVFDVPQLLRKLA